MSKSKIQPYWWLVVVATLVLVAAFFFNIKDWYPAYEAILFFLGMALLGAGFCWMYLTDKAGNWWALIPGLSLFTILAAGAADLIFGTDPKNDWINVLVLGLGTAIIGVLLKRRSAKLVLYVVAMFCFMVGILMSPAVIWLKIVLVAVDLAVAVYFLWRIRKITA